eukprot:TRINITY_DN4782_c0_g1_i1.p1 TRINITY_DN4782_c0_g1~~TRINITY_DN4782_c0_g1_i1.p1  ORF type:complete len:959 (-),score=180.57 TRINITY_DN4782_c0_g1_i1:103-2979(-)
MRVAILCWVVGIRVAAIQRHFRGDIFQDAGCSPSACGVANSSPHVSPVAVAVESEKQCSCQCDTEWPTFREDTPACVDTVQECQLADFVTGGSTEQIPFVFLPLSGQLVYPSASLAIPTSMTGGGLVSPICVVSTVEIMTNKGWKDINNITQDFQQPFQLYRENEKTYLQWMGKEVLHQSLEGRLVLVHLLCKDSAKGRRKLFSPCISFRIAGSPGKAVRVEVYNSDEILTERDYLAIGLCAGFLVLLYIFVMIVLIIMKKKQRRDARLREQFLNMPLPSGLGYKSSRILGLEQGQEKNKVGLNDEVRYSTKSKSFSQIEHKITSDLARMQNGIADKEEEKIYDITKNSNSGSESDASTVMELNEKLLEAHKKVVQQKLNSEVARTIFEGGKNPSTHQDISDSENDTEDKNAMEDLVSKKSHANVGKRNSSKFAPRLEEIKEESRSSSKRAQEEGRLSDKDKNRASDMLNRKSVEESETHFSSDTSTLEPRSLKNISPQGDKTNYYNHMNKIQLPANFNPQSLDSGIVTRSTSSRSPDNDSEDHDFGSQDLDTDNDIVDSEINETEDSDSEDNLDLVTDDDSEIHSKRGPFSFGRNNNPENQNNRHNLKFMDERNSDILSDIYSTAFSKVPKVLPSDSESIYSLTSTLDRDFDYDSLDQKLMNNMRDIYRNPHLLKKSSKQRVEREDSSVYEEINMKKEADIKPPEVSEVYINNDYDTNTLESMNISEEDSTDTHENLVYSSGEKMMIAISGDSESEYSNKLWIEVNNEQPLRQNNEKKSYGYTPAGTGRVNQQRRWNNFGSADSLEVIDQESEAHNNDADDEPMINYKHQIAKPKFSPTISQLNSNQSDHFMKPVSHMLTRATGFQSSGVLNNKPQPLQPIMQQTNMVRPAPSTPTLRHIPPSLPPKTRSTPKLPPKPLEKSLSNSVQNPTDSMTGKRPLPPLPPPRGPPPPPPLPQ